MHYLSTYKMDHILRDVVTLYYAMKGLGTDDTVIINIFMKQPKLYLEQIAQYYENQYHRTLEHHIRQNTSFDYKKLLVRTLLPSIKIKEETCRNFFNIPDLFNWRPIINCIIHTKNVDLILLKLSYTKLIHNISLHAHTQFKSLLLRILRSGRNESIDVNLNQVYIDVDNIYKAIDKPKLFPKHKKFISIIYDKSPHYLYTLNAVYQQKHGYGVLDIIKRRVVTSSYKSLILSMFMQPSTYYAKRLYSIFKYTTHSVLSKNSVNELIYIFSIHNPTDMKFIAQEYNNVYKRILEKDIKLHTLFNFRKCLLEKIRN